MFNYIGKNACPAPNRRLQFDRAVETNELRNEDWNKHTKQKRS
jgi:hypothetical protein